MNETDNFYDVLHVSKDATADTIRQAATQLANDYHEKAKQDPTAQSQLDQIKQAYKVLSSPYRRNAYDISLEEQEIEQHNNQPSQLQNAWQAMNAQQLGNLLKPAWLQKQPANTTTEQLLDDDDEFEDDEEDYLEEEPLPKPQPQRADLLEGEEVIERAWIHPLLIFDLIGLILFSAAGYALLNDPFDLMKNTPNLIFWLPDSVHNSLPTWLTAALSSMTVWALGLWVLFIMGALILIDGIIEYATTRIVVTNQRLIAKYGLLVHNITTMKLPAFDCITLERGVFGWLLGYGNLTVTASGGKRIKMPYLFRPSRFERLLWKLSQEKETYTNHAN